MFFLVVQYVQRVLGFGPLAAGRGVPAAQPGHLRDVAGDARGCSPGSAPGAMIMVGTPAWPSSFALARPRSARPTPTSARSSGRCCSTASSAGLVFMPVTATVLSGVEPEHAGAASGLLQTTQQLGGAIGVAAIVSVYAAGAVPGEFVPGVRAAFLTSAAFTRRRVRGRASPRCGPPGSRPRTGPRARSPSWPRPPDGAAAARPRRPGTAHRRPGRRRTPPLTCGNYRCVVRQKRCYGCDW